MSCECECSSVAPADGAVVLEDDDVAEPEVLLEIQHAIAPGPEHPLDGLLGHRRQRGAVLRRLDDHFVRADPVHPVEQPLALAIQRAFDPQHRKLVRHDAHFPASAVGGRAVAIGQNLGRRLVLVPFAERAESVRPGGDRLDLEIVGPLLPLGRDDDPAAGDGIFSQISHENRMRSSSTSMLSGAAGRPRDADDVEATGHVRQTLLTHVRRSHPAQTMPFLPRDRLERAAETATRTSPHFDEHQHVPSRATMSSSPHRVRKRRSRIA